MNLNKIQPGADAMANGVDSSAANESMQFAKGISGGMKAKVLALITALSAVGCEPGSQAKDGRTSDAYSADATSADSEQVGEGPEFGAPRVLANPSKVIVFGSATTATSMKITVESNQGEQLFTQEFPIDAGFYNVKAPLNPPAPYGSLVRIEDPKGNVEEVVIKEVGDMPDFPEKK